MILPGLEICIIGGGIGGLAAAAALAARGAQVTVLEQADALREVGAGLQISPNGLRVIEALGLADGLAATSVAGLAVSLRAHHSGREVARLDLTRLPSDQRYFFTHRSDLLALLAGAARDLGVRIELDRQVSAITPGSRPQITFSNGETCDTALVVGADGLHSVLRATLNGPSRPFFTGQVAWRSVIANVTGQQPEAQVHMGPGRHLVCYPLRGGQQLNLVAVLERESWADEGWHHSDDPENLRAAFAGFSPQVQTSLAAVEETHLWGLFRHQVAPRWHGHRSVLLGDAAHPTLPFLAQGANMALEDAWCLAASLAGHDSIAAALAGFQNSRMARTQRIIAAANGNAWKYHLRPGPIRFVAHSALNLSAKLAPTQFLRQFDWLYGYDVTRAG